MKGRKEELVLAREKGEWWSKRAKEEGVVR